jgi:hypothetical protein
MNGFILPELQLLYRGSCADKAQRGNHTRNLWIDFPLFYDPFSIPSVAPPLRDGYLVVLSCRLMNEFTRQQGMPLSVGDTMIK